MALLRLKAGPRRRRHEERNTFRLPQGASIRRLLREMFRAQRRVVFAALGLRDGRKDGGPLVPVVDFDPPLQMGQLDFAERFTPLLEAIWDGAGRALLARVGLDPDEWRVTDPHLREMIAQAAMDFCAATNATTSRNLEDALADLRAELIAGQVDGGETLEELVKRVNGVFDQAETWRARRIAASEASRAVHAAELESARQSGVVAGFEWLLSEDACALCQAVAREVVRVRLGATFAVIGDNPTYREIRHPPLHPGCQCSVTEVLKPAYGGPSRVDWGSTLTDER